MEKEIAICDLLVEIKFMIDELFICESYIENDYIVLKFEDDQKFQISLNKLN